MAPFTLVKSPMPELAAAAANRAFPAAVRRDRPASRPAAWRLLLRVTAAG